MDGLAIALVYALLPAGGNFAGGLLSTFVQVTPRVLSIALHAATGVLLAVISVELMPTALATTRPWVVILAFLGGGAAFIALDAGVHVVNRRLGRDATSPAVAIFFAVSVDLFTDGVMIGAGTTIAAELGLLLALGQVPADLPEGFATVASLKERGVPTGRRLLWSAALGLPVLAGTLTGYFAVRGQPEIVKLALLAFAAGILLSVVVEEIVPEAHEEHESRWAAFALVAGFSVFALVATYAE